MNNKSYDCIMVSLPQVLLLQSKYYGYFELEVRIFELDLDFFELFFELDLDFFDLDDYGLDFVELEVTVLELDHGFF